MRLILKTLELENFKGIARLRLGFNERITEIRGDNGTGKTSVADAFHWLMTGKDSMGRTEFQLKTLKNGQEVKRLTHSVQAEVCFDGKDFTLRRTLSEKWVRQKGTAEPQMQGHETGFFIDGVPYRQKEFTEFLAKYFDPEQFTLVSSAAAFNAMPWQRRRLILLDVCGGLSDAEVIAACPELAELDLSDPGTKRRAAADRRRKLRDELDTIPARTEELAKSVAGYASYDALTLRSQADSLRARIDAAKATGGLSELLKRRSEAELNKQELMKLFEKDKNAIRMNAEQAFYQARRELAAADDELSALRRRRDSLSGEIALKEQKLVGLSGEVKKYSSPSSVSSDCPACGRLLDADKIETARRKAELARTEYLAAAVSEERELQSRISGLKHELELLDGWIREQEQTLTAKKSAAEQARINILNLPEPAEPESLRQAGDGIRELERQIEDREQADIAPIEQELAEVSAKLSDICHRDRVNLQISELQKRENELSNLLAACERELFLIDRFTAVKASMLQEKVGEKFDKVRFSLFDTQINGGINEVCITLLDGVPYGTGLNRGAEVNAGLDIVNTLSAHYGLFAPVFLDNAESVTSLASTDSQLIKLIVDGKAKSIVAV